MKNLFNMKLFHESTTKELDVIKNRVRNLIGDRNWGEEGRFKEAILRNVIKRFLPQNFIIGTGFIIKSDDNFINRYEIECSKQIDILIFDASYPILFSEGDFYIITPDSVRAVIEVKTDIKKQNLTEVLKKMNDLGDFLERPETYQSIVNDSPLFNGIFSFKGYNNIKNTEDVETRLENKIKDGVERNNHVNHISLNPHIFLKNFRHIYHEHGLTKYAYNIFSVYRIKNLSFSYFISNLLSFLVKKPFETHSDLWFPTEKGNYKLKDISLQVNR